MKFHKSGGLFFVEDSNLNIFGVAETKDAAFHEFIRHVVYFHKYYSEMKIKPVMPEAMRLKKLYSDFYDGKK